MEERKRMKTAGKSLRNILRKFPTVNLKKIPKEMTSGSKVNSCSTFQSWDWWCTKGKGKVNRCTSLSYLFPCSLFLLCFHLLSSVAHGSAEFILGLTARHREHWDTGSQRPDNKTLSNFPFFGFNLLQLEVLLEFEEKEELFHENEVVSQD